MLPVLAQQNLSTTDDQAVDQALKVLKELLVQVFTTPNFHPKSQPFVDHVLNFSILDNKIWVRNYQIGDEKNGLAEIGPRLEIYFSVLF